MVFSYIDSLTQLKGFAVCALAFGGVSLVSANLDFIKRTVILILCVVSALLNLALYMLVGTAVAAVTVVHHN